MDHDKDVVRSERVYAEQEADVRMESTRERFGGIDVPATLVGALVALALTAILGAVAGAVLGTTMFANTTDTTAIQSSDVFPAAIVGGVVLALAYFIGGWAAGRVARYNGTRNGIVAALWTLLLTVAAGVGASYFGDRYDVMSRIGVPNWMTSDSAMTGGIIGGVAAVVLMLLFAALGGRRGEVYHHRADVALTEPHFDGA